MTTKILNKLKEVDYKQVASILGYVLLDTLCAIVVFYLLYWMFSIPNIWIAVVAITSLYLRSESYDKYY